MNIKKYIQNHKTMMIVVVGILATVATVSAVYFSNGGLFSGYLVGLINPAPLPIVLPPITDYGVTHTYLSATTLDLSAANHSITFTYGLKMNKNPDLSIYVLPNGSNNDVSKALKKWDWKALNPVNGYNSVSWDGIDSNTNQPAAVGTYYFYTVYLPFIFDPPNTALALQSTSFQVINPPKLIPLPVLDKFFVDCAWTPTLSPNVDVVTGIWTAKGTPNQPIIPAGTTFKWTGNLGNAQPSNSPSFTTNYTNNGPNAVTQSVSVSLSNPAYWPVDISCGSISIPPAKQVFHDTTIANITSTPAQIVLGKDALQVTVNTSFMNANYSVRLQFDVDPNGASIQKPNQTIQWNGTNTYVFNFDANTLSAMSAGPHTYQVDLYDSNVGTNDWRMGSFTAALPPVQQPVNPIPVVPVIPPAPVVPPVVQTPGCAGYYDISLSSTTCQQYGSALEYAKTKKIMTGNPDGTFGPYAFLQRDQILKVLKLGDANVPATLCNNVTPFPDVPSTLWSCNLIAEAKQNLIVTGYLATGLYMPANPVNRAEFATMMTRMLKSKFNISVPLDSAKNYKDVPPTDWYTNYAAFFFMNGLFPGDYMNPPKPMTRVEVAQIVYMLHVLGKF